MPSVTVQGANHSTVTLTYDLDANAMLARYVAGEIQAGLANNTVQAFDNKAGFPPALPPGVTGEFVQSVSGTTLLPKGYDFLVDSAKTANVFGNGDASEQVLVGSGDLSFYASKGSGVVIGGGGKDLVSIAASDVSNWLVALGNGNDTVRATGSGDDYITLGSGKDAVQLGAGSTFLTTSGSDTVMAGSGSETIQASGSKASELIYGGSSQLFFVASGPASVFGGSGSDTVFGGKGSDLFQGGSAGNNFLQAGSGKATLFGGGDGDQLYAAGGKAQALHAASGNETLSGAFASGSDTFYGGSGKDQIQGGSGKNTFVAGTGAASITASPGSMNLFELMKAVGGGSELVMGLTDASQVHIDLVGYAPDEASYALKHQKTADGSVTITLTDNTKVTFQNISSLSASNFTTGGGGMGDNSGGSHDGWGHSDDHHDHGHR